MGTVSWLSPLVLVEITDCFYKTGPSSPCINCSLFSCILNFNSYLNLENLFLIVLANIYILCEIYIWNDSFSPPLRWVVIFNDCFNGSLRCPCLERPFLSVRNETYFICTVLRFMEGWGWEAHPSDLLHLK